MKCPKHGREMKWFGSLVKGGMICEDCEFESESVQMEVVGEDDGKGPCSPSLGQASAQSNNPPTIPPGSIGQNPIPQLYGNLPVTFAQFKNAYTRLHLCVPNGFVSVGYIPANPILAARLRAGQYFTIVFNPDTTCFVECPYCLQGIKTGVPHGNTCHDLYYDDLKTGLIQ